MAEGRFEGRKWSLEARNNDNVYCLGPLEGLLDASGVPPGGLWGCLGSFREASLGLLGASWALRRPRSPQEVPRAPPSPLQDGPQKAPDEGQRLPKRGPRGPQEAPRDPKNITRVASQVEIAKTSKMMTLPMKINDFLCRKVTKISPKL
jgi:hypothetical protein